MLWSFLGAFTAIFLMGLVAQSVKTWPIVGPLHQQVSFHTGAQLVLHCAHDDSALTLLLERHSDGDLMVLLLQGLALLIGSFGTICVLLFARPDGEAIQVCWL